MAALWLFLSIVDLLSLLKLFLSIWPWQLHYSVKGTRRVCCAMFENVPCRFNFQQQGIQKSKHTRRTWCQTQHFWYIYIRRMYRHHFIVGESSAENQRKTRLGGTHFVQLSSALFRTVHTQDGPEWPLAPRLNTTCRVVSITWQRNNKWRVEYGPDFPFSCPRLKNCKFFICTLDAQRSDAYDSFQCIWRTLGLRHLRISRSKAQQCLCTQTRLAEAKCISKQECSPWGYFIPRVRQFILLCFPHWSLQICVFHVLFGQRPIVFILIRSERAAVEKKTSVRPTAPKPWNLQARKIVFKLPGELNNLE